MVTAASFLLVSAVLLLFVTNSLTSGSAQFVFWIYSALILTLLALLHKQFRSVQASLEEFPGIRLQWRIVALFMSMLFLPLLITVTMSFGYFNAELRKYFENDIRRVEANSIIMRNIYVSEQKSALEKDMQDMKDSFLAPSFASIEELLPIQAVERGLSYLAIVERNGRVLQEFGVSQLTPLFSEQKSEQRDLFTSSGEDRVYGSMYLEDGLFLVAERLMRAEFVKLTKDNRSAILALEKGRVQSVNLADSIGFILIACLSLVVLALLWNSLAFSSWIVEKVNTLLKSTARISEGDLKLRIPDLGNNEFGFLGSSFNRLLNSITEKSKQLQDAQSRAEKGKQFMEATLNGVSSGILCLNEQDRIHLMNKSAADLLELDEKATLGENILTLVPELKGSFPQLKTFQMELIRGHKRIFLVVNVGKRGEIALLPKGRVVAMEDITMQIENQKNEIWAHIARSLAHEVKNPLTPIQLSAERLSNKYSPESEKDRKDFLTSVHSIIKQVGIIQEMVDSFSSFATMPRLHIGKVNIDKLIVEAVSLQRGQYPKMKYEVEVEKDLEVKCDSNAINRVLFNLLKNAAQAQAEEGRVLITARVEDERAFLEVQDQGSGFPPDLISCLVEPYMTTKREGSGLGLAIVNRIAQAHGGILILENAKTAKGRVSGALVKVIWKSPN